MEFNSTNFFCGRVEGPILHLGEDLNGSWPIVVRINKDPKNGYTSPSVTLFMREEQFITFKNSVISEYESLLRLRKEREK